VKRTNGKDPTLDIFTIAPNVEDFDALILLLGLNDSSVKSTKEYAFAKPSLSYTLSRNATAEIIAAIKSGCIGVNIV
jgi:hypothetical protein